jgi:predicted phosphodiesterase
MTKIVVIGDVHGKYRYMERILFDAVHFHNVDYAVQVGDMGYAWPREPSYKLGRHRWDDSQRERILSVKKYWIDGNHENHDQLQADSGTSMEGWEYWPRGEVRRLGSCGTFLAIGGATSIDQDHRMEYEARTKEKIWWPQESITTADIDKAMHAVDMTDEPIRGVFSHEYPEGFGYPYIQKVFPCGQKDKDKLALVLHHAQPELWFFGHYHKTANGVYTHKGGERRTHWGCAPDVVYNRYWIIDEEGVTKHKLSGSHMHTL